MIGHITDTSVPYGLNDRELPEPSPAATTLSSTAAPTPSTAAKEYPGGCPGRLTRRAAASPARRPARSAPHRESAPALFVLDLVDYLRQDADVGMLVDGCVGFRQLRRENGHEAQIGYHLN